jgi:hypothetical protein
MTSATEKIKKDKLQSRIIKEAASVTRDFIDFATFAYLRKDAEVPEHRVIDKKKGKTKVKK